jgi:amino acid permease
MLPIMIFANGVHPSIPTITQYLKNKRINIFRVLKVLFLTTGILYSVLGLTVSAAISDVPPLCTLAWENYGDGRWWAYIIQYIVLLFPAADATSSFPLNGIVLAENLMSMKYSHLSITDLESLPRSLVIKYRLFVIIPPMVLAFFFFSLAAA